MFTESQNQYYTINPSSPTFTLLVLEKLDTNTHKTFTIDLKLSLITKHNILMGRKHSNIKYLLRFKMLFRTSC